MNSVSTVMNSAPATRSQKAFSSSFAVISVMAGVLHVSLPVRKRRAGGPGLQPAGRRNAARRLTVAPVPWPLRNRGPAPPRCAQRPDRWRAPHAQFRPTGASMHRYRTHTCGALRPDNAGQAARLSGWVHRKRDHGNLLFIDLRDHYGITQCVVDTSSPLFGQIEAVRPESVITVTGRVVKRTAETINPKLPTGEIELRVEEYRLQAAAEMLPLQVNSDEDSGEDLRLTYRFLDLRRERIHRNILLRSKVIASIRRRMVEG